MSAINPKGVIFLLAAMLLLVSLFGQNKPTPPPATTPAPTASTKTPTTPKLPETLIAEFWRAKSNIQTAQSSYDAVVQQIRTFCGHDGIFGPDGHPACGVDTAPVAVAPAPPQNKPPVGAPATAPAPPAAAKAEPPKSTGTN